MRCDDCINRRQFLSAAAGAAGFMAVAGCGDGYVTGVLAEPVTITVGDFPALATTGVLVQVPHQPIVVKRIGPTSFEAFSMVCTHQGCTTQLNPAGTQLNCPCHFSIFGADGAVIQGPAEDRLGTFATAYDQATDQLTIA